MSEEDKQLLLARVLLTHDNKVLVLKRSKSSGREGKWEFPGGKVEQGESIEDAAKREIKEETGIQLDNISYHHSDSYNFEDQQRMGVLFTAESSSDDVKLSDEHDDFAWVDASNYNNRMLEPIYRQHLDEFFDTDTGEQRELFINVNATTNDKLIIYTDGGSRGNPGPSASGYVILNKDEELLEEGGEYLGITTNNQAEYQAVKLALSAAEKYKAKEINFFIDSLLVVNQMIGKFKIKNRDLWPIHQDIKHLMEKFDKVTYTHVKRELNKLADAEVNKVLDSYEHREG